VESSFNLKAISKVGASGVWQLMPTIGKKYLVMDDQAGVDERRSPLKATIAAGKLLTWNYNYLGNWPLAIISYNHGLKNLPRFKDHSTDFNKMANLFDGCIKKPLLGWASRNYYSEFLAVVYAESYRELFYGKTPSSGLTTIAYRQLEKRQSVFSYALEKGVALQQIKHLNADVENLKTPLPAGFWVAVPSEEDEVQTMVESSLHPKKKSKAVAQTRPAPKKAKSPSKNHRKVAHAKI
jgi:membrane-bound lytic murein transglycosylase D